MSFRDELCCCLRILGNLPRNRLAGMYVPLGGASEFTQFWVLVFELPGGESDPSGGAGCMILFPIYFRVFHGMLTFSFEWYVGYIVVCDDMLGIKCL